MHNAKSLFPNMPSANARQIIFKLSVPTTQALQQRQNSCSNSHEQTATSPVIPNLLTALKKKGGWGVGGACGEGIDLIKPWLQ